MNAEATAERFRTLSSSTLLLLGFAGLLFVMFIEKHSAWNQVDIHGTFQVTWRQNVHHSNNTNKESEKSQLGGKKKSEE